MITWENPKFEALNPKRFGKLTALSQFEGQIRMTEIQNSRLIYPNVASFRVGLELAK